MQIRRKQASEETVPSLLFKSTKKNELNFIPAAEK